MMTDDDIKNEGISRGICMAIKSISDRIKHKRKLDIIVTAPGHEPTTT